MSRLLSTTAVAALLLLALGGCGQKGPLYLPQPESEPGEEESSSTSFAPAAKPLKKPAK